MKLTELNPKFGRSGGPVVDRIIFDCPKCKAHRIAVPIPPDEKAWIVEGNSFENITLSPSIKHYTAYADGMEAEPRECHWHGWIRKGEIIEA